MSIIRNIYLILVSILMLAAVVMAVVFFTPYGADFVLRFSADRLLGHGVLSYERMEGSLFKGLRVAHIEIQHPFVFSEGTVVRVQQVDMRLARFGLDGIDVVVENARVIDPKADPVVVNADVQAGRYHANVYSRTLNLSSLRKIIKHFRNMSLPQGELKDLDLLVSGTLLRPTLKGTFIIDKISQKGLALHEAPVACDVYFVRSAGLWSTYGKLVIRRGSLQGPKVLLHLKESRLIFSGDPVDPELDIKAAAFIDRTRIEIVLKGTRKDPQLSLSSEPALPQEQILLMLTTGKRWDSVNASMANHKMTPELMGDFISLFFLGGLDPQSVKFLGIDGVSYKMGQDKQGVLVNKEVTERLGVGYGVEVSQAQQKEQRIREITQTLEGEYRLTDKMTIGAQKEILPQQAASGVDDNARKMPNDKVYLRYKTDF